MFGFGKSKLELELEEKLKELNKDYKTKKTALDNEIDQAKATVDHWQAQLSARHNHLHEISLNTDRCNKSAEEKVAIIEGLQADVAKASETLAEEQREHSKLLEQITGLENWVVKLDQEYSELETDGVYKILTERFNHVFPDNPHEPIFSPSPSASQSINEGGE